VLAPLRELQLEQLTLFCDTPSFTAAAILELVCRCPRLRQLDLAMEKAQELTDSWLETVVKSCPRLMRLELGCPGQNTSITAETIEKLAIARPLLRINPPLTNTFERYHIMSYIS